MDLEISSDLDRHEARLGDRRLVFHCHHYNCALQKAIEDGMGGASVELLREGAVPGRVRQFRANAAGQERVFALATEMYRTLGFGVLNLSGVSSAVGEAIVENSHYSMGWLARYGARETPVDHFSCGFIKAACIVAFDGESVRVIQTSCMTMGAARNEFKVEAL